MPVLLALCGHTMAADPVHYTVAIAPTGEDALDAAVHDAATLLSLRENAPVGPFALVARARDDAGRFAAALRSFGYYRGSVSVTIDGRPLDDPDLADRLDALPATAEAPVAVNLARGPLFHLRHIALLGPAPADAEAKLTIHPGMPARAVDVLAAGTVLLQALRGEGYALATVAAPLATVDQAAEAIDVSFAVDAGPRVELGAIGITGLDRLHEDYVRRRLTLHQGERFDPAKLEAARQDLYNTGLFADTRVTTPDRLDAAGQLPVNIVVKERPLHAVKLSADWSTDQGAGAGASWTHRDLFGEAEQLTLSANVTGLGGTAEQAPGYNVNAQLLIPDWRERDQSLTFSAGGVREFLEAYDRSALLASATFGHRLADHLTGTVGLAGEAAHITQEDADHDYTLLQAPLGLDWNTANGPLDPTHGLHATLKLTPTFSFGNAGDQTFVLIEASASTYFDLAGNGRTVLALRGLVGAAPGISNFAIPPDQRFYAGGGGSIRGFRFQSVGPTFADGHPTGGTGVDVGSVELRQRIGANWGAVGFVDAGQLSTAGVPFSGPPRVGTGVGVRYYTSFGPIRFDVATPLTRISKSDVIEAYIGLGQAF